MKHKETWISTSALGERQDKAKIIPQHQPRAAPIFRVLYSLTDSPQETTHLCHVYGLISKDGLKTLDDPRRVLDLASGDLGELPIYVDVVVIDLLHL